MSLILEVEKSKVKTDKRKITTPKDVYKLKEIQEIKDATNEHLFFIGLNNQNYINKINLIALGTGNIVNIKAKDIVRQAILNECSKVIIVHNHPSNITKPSKKDCLFTNVIQATLDVFQIEFLDHIVVGKDDYCSIMSEKVKKNNIFEGVEFEKLSKVELIEENLKLKSKIKELENDNLKYIEKKENDIDMDIV